MSNELAKLKELAAYAKAAVSAGIINTRTGMEAVTAFESEMKPDAVIALIEQLQAAQREVSAAKARIAELQRQYDDRTPTQWAYDQACAALNRKTAELAAIKGEQKPIGYIDSASLREYRGVKAGGSWSALPKTGEYNQTTPIYTHPAPAVLQGKPVVPEGWKLVPIEPTPEMLDASWVHHNIYHPSAYRTMLAAAPTPGGDRG